MVGGFGSFGAGLLSVSNPHNSSGCFSSEDGSLLNHLTVCMHSQITILLHLGVKFQSGLSAFSICVFPSVVMSSKQSSVYKALLTSVVGMFKLMSAANPATKVVTSHKIFYIRKENVLI